MVEIIPKKAPLLPQWLNILFYFSLAFLIFSIASFFLLNNSIKKNQETLIDLEESLAERKTSENVSLEKEILKYQRKTDDFSQIIGGHLKTSEVFEILQKNCHPRVRFSQFNLESRQNYILLSGNTDSFESLGQQLLIFKGEALVRGADLEKVSINKEGGISFSLSLPLDPKIFK